MELSDFSQVLTPAFFSALVAILVIDLALAGDNAIVIGLAARRVPPHLQRKVLIWGSVAAVLVRAIFSLFVVWLLKIPGFLLAGGIVLLYIAYKLVQPQKESESENESNAQSAHASTNVRQAVTTIVLADTAMGIENVLAVGGVAHGNMLLVITGLLISVPIIMFGSQLVLRMVDRFPHIITAGGAILAWTAVKMMLGEPALEHWFEIQDWVEVPIYLAAVGFIIFIGVRSQSKK